MTIDSGTAQPYEERDSAALPPDQMVQVMQQWIYQKVQEVSAEQREIIEENLKVYTDNSFKKLKQSLDKKIQDASKEFRDQIEISKTSALQILALFVALFTFISVNITIFAKIEYLSAGLWFMFLMLIALLTFLFALNIFINARAMSWQKLVINLVFVILIGSVIPVLLYITKNDEKLNPQININKSTHVGSLVTSEEPPPAKSKSNKENNGIGHVEKVD